MKRKKSFDDVLKQKHLVEMLKAKRIEQGKNLEEVCVGICSVSYLSRIENNQVRLQEPYLSMLFERLDIRYDELLENRNQKVFVELLEKYFLGEYTDFYNKTIELISLNIYLEVERRLIYLFDSVIKKNYGDAFNLIQELELMINILTEEQLNFYIYVISLYYFNTNQINQAHKQIKMVNLDVMEHDIIYWAIKELKLSIWFKVGYNTKYVEEKMLFEKNAPMQYFNKIMYKHEFKMAVLDSKFDIDKSLSDIEYILKKYGENNDEVVENYYYHLGLIYLLDENYNELLKNLTKGPESSRIMQVLIMGLIKTSNNENAQTIEKVNSYGFSKYDEINKNLLKYLDYKKNNIPLSRLHNFLKLYVFALLKYSFDEYLYQFVIVELCSISLKCSKYKEACNLLLKSLKSIKKEFLSK